MFFIIMSVKVNNFIDKTAAIGYNKDILLKGHGNERKTKDRKL